MRLCLGRAGLFGLRCFIADHADFAKQFGHLHATERFEKRGYLRGNFGDVTGDLVSAGSIAIASGDDRDLVHLAERFAEGADNFGQGADEFVHDRGLVVFLESLGLDVHGARFRVTLLEDDFGFGFALRANGRGAAFGFADNALTFDFCALEHGGDQFAFAARDFGVLHLDLRFAFDLLNAHLFEDDVLLLAIGFDLVGLIGLRLGLFADFEIVGLLDVQIALGFGLFCHGSGFGGNALLVCLR